METSLTQAQTYISTKDVQLAHGRERIMAVGGTFWPTNQNLAIFFSLLQLASLTSKATKAFLIMFMVVQASRKAFQLVKKPPMKENKPKLENSRNKLT